MAKRAGDAISYQVSVRGRGLSAMTDDAMHALINRYVDGDDIPDGIDVSVQCWRAGRELDMRADNPRAQVLRDTFRRFLQAGRIELEIGTRSENR